MIYVDKVSDHVTFNNPLNNSSHALCDFKKILLLREIINRVWKDCSFPIDTKPIE